MANISSKLHLYNETLASFQKVEDLQKPRDEEVETYHEYLATKRPVVEAESAFIDRAEDLVSLAPRRHTHAHARAHDEDDVLGLRARPPRRLTATAHNEEEHMFGKHQPTVDTRQLHQQTLYLAALLSVLVPILVFHVIPNLAGRMVVAALVALGIMGLLAQTGATELLALGRKEKLVVAGTWAGGMIALAVIV